MKERLASAKFLAKHSQPMLVQCFGVTTNIVREGCNAFLDSAAQNVQSGSASLFHEIHKIGVRRELIQCSCGSMGGMGGSCMHGIFLEE